jgi:hypothetical protein
MERIISLLDWSLERLTVMVWEIEALVAQALVEAKDWALLALDGATGGSNDGD